MIQLTFQPALDPLHAVFRQLRLRSAIGAGVQLHCDHVRILDFYLLFPYRIEGIRLSPQHRKYKTLAREFAESKPYGSQPEDRIIFERMEALQSAAFRTLAKLHLIEPKELEVGQVSITPDSPPEALASRVAAANEQESNLVGFLSVLAREYPLTGLNGLKARTGLLEYRYDAV